MKKMILPVLVTSVLLFAILISALVLYTGGFASAFAYLNGKPFTITPRKCDLGNREPATEEVVTFLLNNFSEKEVVITGELSGCACTLVEGLPITVHPKETEKIQVRTRLPKYKSVFDQKITFIIKTQDVTLLSSVQITAFIPKPLPIPSVTDQALESDDIQEK